MNDLTEGSLYFIYCRTGCTCCSEKNHVRGPYASLQDAEKRVAYYLSESSKFWPLGSQYARRGRYNIETKAFEILPDGRAIVGDRVYVGMLDTIKINDDGTTESDDAERFNE